MMLSPFKLFFVSGNSNFMNKYYQNQAKDYDAYRYNMLHGKKNMMYGIPFKKDMDILILFDFRRQLEFGHIQSVSIQCPSLKGDELFLFSLQVHTL